MSVKLLTDIQSQASWLVHQILDGYSIEDFCVFEAPIFRSRGPSGTNFRSKVVFSIKFSLVAVKVTFAAESSTCYKTFLNLVL